MGKHIENIGVSFDQKISALEEKGGKKIDPPTDWVENLVCVVNNGPFAAAAYAFSASEMNVFLSPDGRAKQWMLVPEASTLAK